MSDDGSECQFIIDTSGLHELANTKSNSLKQHYFTLLKHGVIQIPKCVWDEFKEAYEDEADALRQFIPKRFKVREKHRTAAASIVEKLNSSLSFSPYDNKSDLYAASICKVEGYMLLTSASNQKVYIRMACCSFMEWTKLVE